VAGLANLKKNNIDWQGHCLMVYKRDLDNIAQR
jgi:hypothetical protein